MSIVAAASCFLRAGAISRILLIPVLVAAVACGSSRPFLRLEPARGKPIVVEPRPIKPIDVSEGAFKAALLEMTASWRPPSAQAARSLMLAEGGPSFPGAGGRKLALWEPQDSGPTGKQLLVQWETFEQRSLKDGYSLLCERRGTPGDCLSLFDDGPRFEQDDKMALALRIALSSALRSTAEALDGITAQQVEVAVLSALAMYIALIIIPEPFSKLAAIVLTTSLIAYVGVDVFRSFVGGFRELSSAVKVADSFEAVYAAGERYGRQIGPSGARTIVMLALFAMGKAVGSRDISLRLPAASQAAANAELQGFVLAGAAQGVTSVAVTLDGSVVMGMGAFSVAAPWVMRDREGEASPAPEGVRSPHREKPRIEDGNLNEGWKHIEARHVRGDHPTRGPGDLFAPGTTREQLTRAAEEIVRYGNRASHPNQRLQTFQMKIRVNGVNGQDDLVRVIVDPRDGNRVITMFPVRR